MSFPSTGGPHDQARDGLHGWFYGGPRSAPAKPVLQLPHPRTLAAVDCLCKLFTCNLWSLTSFCNSQTNLQTKPSVKYRFL